MKRLILRKE